MALPKYEEHCAVCGKFLGYWGAKPKIKALCHVCFQWFDREYQRSISKLIGTTTCSGPKPHFKT